MPSVPRVPVVAGAVLGGLVLVLGAVLSVPFLGFADSALIGGLLTVLLLAVAAALATWLPAAALAVAWLGAIVQMAFGLSVLPVDLVILGVLFATGAAASVPLRWTGLASALLGGLAAALYLSAASLLQDPVGAAGAFLTMLVAASGALLLAWTFGLLRRTLRGARAQRQAALAAQQQAIEAQERGRIARDMHDVVAHSLAVIVAQADGARYLGDADAARARETLGTVSTVAREALGEVRVLLARLRHRQGNLPQPGRGELGGLIQQVREAGLEVVLEERELPERLPAASDLALYRIVQESLTNALRHGDPSRPVRVLLGPVGAELRLEVRSALRSVPAASAPRAAAPPAPPGPPGHGLVGMRERAWLAGGGFHAGAMGDEFVVVAMLPIGEAA